MVLRPLGWEDPLEEGMASHSSILAWRIPTDRGAWRPIVHGVAKSRTSEAFSVRTSKGALRLRGAGQGVPAYTLEDPGLGPPVDVISGGTWLTKNIGCS